MFMLENFAFSESLFLNMMNCRLFLSEHLTEFLFKLMILIFSRFQQIDSSNRFIFSLFHRTFFAGDKPSFKILELLDYVYIHKHLHFPVAGASLKVTDFTTSVHGSSCNSLVHSFCAYFLASHPALGIRVNRKRMRQSENAAGKEIIT